MKRYTNFLTGKEMKYIRKRVDLEISEYRNWSPLPHRIKGLKKVNEGESLKKFEQNRLKKND